MILGIGVDAVEIKRFIPWTHYSQKKLLRIFSPEEIDYCLSNSKKTAERLAVRFAAREAFYKAFCAIEPKNSLPFFTLCKSVAVCNTQIARLAVHWNKLALQPKKKIKTHLSLTHSNHTATAFVVLETH